MIFIFSACADEKEAEHLGKMVLDQKLGACVDYWPITSMYYWQGEFKNLTQTMMMITTFEVKLEDVNALISKHHSYDAPMIAGFDIRRINRAYKEWMAQNIT